MLSDLEIRRSVVDMSHGKEKTVLLRQSFNVMDPRTGTPDPKIIPCATCGGALKCPGHSAHIMLPFPVYAQQFFAKSTYFLLFGVCPWCCRMLLDKEDIAHQIIDAEMPHDQKLYQSTRMIHLLMPFKSQKRNGVNSVLCPHCHMPQPVYQATHPKKWTHIEWTWPSLALQYVKRDGRVAHAIMDQIDETGEVYEPESDGDDEDEDEEEEEDHVQPAAIDHAPSGIPRDMKQLLAKYHRMTTQQKLKARERAGAPLLPEEKKAALHEMRQPFNTVRCRAILTGFARDWPEDLKWLGIQDSHPEQWVPQAIPVIPNIFRPTVRVAGARSGRNSGNHDLTFMYNKMRQEAVVAWEWCVELRNKAIPDAKAAAAAKELVRHVDSEAHEVPVAMPDHLPMGADEMTRFLHSGYRQRQAYERISTWFNAITCNHGVSVQTKQSTSRPYESVRSLLDGKTGIIRDQIVGKRVNHSGRFPIIGDDSITPSEVGMPHVFLRTATIRERAYDLNLKDLRKAVQIGVGIPGGAAQIEPSDGDVLELDQLDLDHRNLLASKLQPGWFVHRYMRTGDVVLMNRAPTLWKQGIMAHLIHGTLNPDAGEAARIPLPCTKPYNADFDGDEMQFHALQDLQARAEAMVLASVDNNILSQQTGQSVMGLVQDDLTSIHDFTSKDTIINKSDAAQLLVQRSTTGATFERSGMQPQAGMAQLGEPAILIPRQDGTGEVDTYWTGKQLLSQAATADTLLHLDASNQAGTRRPSGTLEERLSILMDDGRVVFRDGQLLAGQLDKRIVGGGGVVISALAKYSPVEQAASSFMARAGFTMREYASTQGFTVTPDDFALTKEAFAAIQKDNDVAQAEAERLEDIARQLGISYNVFEDAMMEIGQAVQELVTRRTMQDMKQSAHADGRRHNVLSMIAAGSKGSSTDITHIAGGLGQMQAGGGRINNRRNPDPTESGGLGLADAKARVLPCFRRGDAGLSAHGYTRRSYMTGMSFPAFNSNAMFSIEGVVKATTATARAGYTHRRLVLALGQNVGSHGFTVDGRRIVEWRSGGDTFAPAQLQYVAANRWMECADIVWQRRLRGLSQLFVRHALRDREILREQYIRREGPSGVVRVPFAIDPMLAMRAPLDDTIVPRADDPTPSRLGRRATAPLPPGPGDELATEEDVESALLEIQMHLAPSIGRSATRLISSYCAWELSGRLPAPAEHEEDEELEEVATVGDPDLALIDRTDEEDTRFLRAHPGGAAVPLLRRNAMFDCLNQASRPLRALLTCGNLLMMWGFQLETLAQQPLLGHTWEPQRASMLAWRNALADRFADCAGKVAVNALTNKWWLAREPILIAERQAEAPVTMCRHRPPMLHLRHEQCAADSLGIPVGSKAGVFVINDRLNLGPTQQILKACRRLNLKLAIVLAKEKIKKPAEQAFWQAKRDEGIQIRYFKLMEADTLVLGHWMQPAFQILDPHGAEARAALARAGKLEIGKLTTDDPAVRMLGVPVGQLLAIHVAQQGHVAETEYRYVIQSDKERVFSHKSGKGRKEGEGQDGHGVA